MTAPLVFPPNEQRAGQVPGMAPRQKRRTLGQGSQPMPASGAPGMMPPPPNPWGGVTGSGPSPYNPPPPNPWANMPPTGGAPPRPPSAFGAEGGSVGVMHGDHGVKNTPYGDPGGGGVMGGDPRGGGATGGVPWWQRSGSGTGSMPLPKAGGASSQPYYYGREGRGSAGMGGSPNVFGGVGGQPPTGGSVVPDWQRVSAPPRTQYTADDNYLNDVFNPNPSDRLRGYDSRADAASEAYGNTPWRSLGPVDTSTTVGALDSGRNLVGQMARPTYQAVAGTDLSGARRILGDAAGSTGPGGFALSGQAGSARGLTLDQLKKVMGDSPDRASLAADTYAQLLERSAPGEQVEDRQHAQRTAALGRTGSGMYNSEQADIQTARERERDLARRQLATESAGLSLSDQLDKLGAAEGVSNSFANQDIGAGGLNLSAANSRFRNTMDLAGMETDFAQITRGDALDERAARREAEDASNRVLGTQADSERRYGLDRYGLDADAYDRSRGERDAEYDAARGRAFDFADLASGVRGDERADRNELRGERDYQYGRERDAVGDARDQYLMEQDELDRVFRRNMQRYQLGSQGSPVGGYERQADIYGQADPYADAAALAAESERRRREQAGGSRPPSRRVLGSPVGYGGGEYA